MCPRCVVWCGVWQFWTNPSLCPQCVYDVWCGVWQFWTNPSLCPHSGLNRVSNMWCLQILNQPLLHCVALKFCSNPWFCLHSDRNLPVKDSVFLGNPFLGIVRLVFLFYFFFHSPLFSQPRGQKRDFVSSRQRQKETCLLELFSFELAVLTSAFI